MKVSIFSLALVAGLAAAQSDKIPSCATSCITKYTTGDGIAGCGQVDIKCICSNKDFLNGIACCLQDKCDASGQAAAVKYAKQICSTAGVTVPDQVTCNKDTSSESASASESAASKSASESVSAASKSESNSDSTATAKSAASETGSAATSGTTAAASTATATGSSSAASSTSSGAAVAGMDSVGGLLGAVMAVLFAL